MQPQTPYPNQPPAAPDPTEQALRYIVPSGKTSALAVLAGYAGIGSILILPGPVALILGIVALRHLAKHPEAVGKGRAWTGIIMGGLATLLMVIFLIINLLNGSGKSS